MLSPTPAPAEPVACWACGTASADPDPVLGARGFIRCAGCGLRFAPESDPEELQRLYGDEYFEGYDEGRGYGVESSRRAYEARRRAALVRRHAAGGRLLEVGSAAGDFLGAARDAGFDPVGVEPGPAVAAASAARFGLPVHAGFLEEVELPAASFDVVCAWHVLEHIGEPAGAVARMRDVLRPGGVLLLEVPNIASVQFERMGLDWPHISFPYHVGHYTPAALTALVEGAGLQVVDRHTFPGNGYVEPALAVRPRMLAGAALEAVRLRAWPRRAHPSRQELLRIVARRPG